VEETVTTFDELVTAGKIRHYGLSNVAGDELARADDAAVRLGVRRPVNLQAGFNLLERDIEPSLDVCTGRGIAFTAFSPLAGGLLSGKYRRDRPVPAGSRLALIPSYGELVGERLYAVLGMLEELAAVYGGGPAAVALAWVLGTPGVAGALVAPRSVAHLDMMCAALDIALSEEELAALADLSAADGQR
jgi:aryl-alcohol dehydrogenase-like predicted oxidoreductase